MIGVIAPPSLREIVLEFFELFKTPAELYDERAGYDVILVSGGDVPAILNCRLLLVYTHSVTVFDRSRHISVTKIDKTCHVERDGRDFILYRGCATFDTRPVGVHESMTKEPVAYAGEEAGVPFVRVGYDLFEEISHLLSDGQPPNLSEYPSLERHIDFLRDVIVSSGVPLAEVPPAPVGYDFAVCLTHDVDHPSLRLHGWDHTTLGFIYRGVFGSIRRLIQGRIGWAQVLQNAGAVIRVPFILCGLAGDIWKTFRRYLEIERGLGATYFFLTRKNDPGLLGERSAPAKRASKYDVSDVCADITELASCGSEIGVHGINAWRDSEGGRDERAALGSVTERQEVGIRMHWLYYDSATPRRLEAAGYAYDSTYGYNGAVGYRAGTLQLYRPQGCKYLLEVPLHVMDTALFYPSHLNLSFADAWNVVAPLIDAAERHGGVLTLNWHDRSIAPERLWEPFYTKLIGELKQRGAWFPTVGQAVKWFRGRREVVFERPVREGAEWKITANAGTAAMASPRLRLRVHRPSKLQRNVREWTCESSWSRTEVELESSASVCLTLDQSFAQSNGSPLEVCNA